MSEHQIYLMLTLLAIIAGNGLGDTWLRGYIHISAGMFYMISILSTEFARGFINGLMGWSL